jgi:hypothetical protein
MNLDDIARRGECAARLDDVCSLEDLRAIVECPPPDLPTRPMFGDVLCGGLAAYATILVGLIFLRAHAATFATSKRTADRRQ